MLSTGISWLIHRLTYRRTNHGNIHVRGYKEEGTITTAFDMTVILERSRSLPTSGHGRDRPAAATWSLDGIRLKQQLKEKLIDHKQYIAKFQAEDMAGDSLTGNGRRSIRPWRVIANRSVDILEFGSGFSLPAARRALASRRSELQISVDFSRLPPSISTMSKASASPFQTTIE